jgi:hypothetical protein
MLLAITLVEGFSSAFAVEPVAAETGAVAAALGAALSSFEPQPAKIAASASTHVIALSLIVGMIEAEWDGVRVQ